MAIDRKGSTYVATTAEPGFPTTPGAFQGESTSKTSSGLIAKLNADASSLSYATYLGGALPVDVAVDADGNAFITGYAVSDLPVTPGALQPKPPNRNYSAFVTKVNSTGTGRKACLCSGERTVMISSMSPVSPVMGSSFQQWLSGT